MKNTWLDEFSEFANSQNQVPTELNSKVQSRMHPLLHPSAFLVFAKVMVIHFGVGLASLAFCHQFGLNPFQTRLSLDSWFTDLGGHHFCMLACGFLFVALSLLAAGVWISIEELKALKKNGFLQTLSLALFSLALFHFFGAELVLGMAAFWLFGGLLAGLLTTEVVWKLRTV